MAKNNLKFSLISLVKQFVNVNLYKIMGALFSIFLVGFSLKNYKTIFDEKKQESNSLSAIENLDINNLYSHGVQKIFNARCVACHGCYESPCQLNLQSYEGLERGVNENYVFDRDRSEEAPATKLFEDASGLGEWRRLGFKDVIGNREQSVLLNALELSQGKRPPPRNSYPDSRQCINQETPNLHIRMQDKYLAMPHNLPAIEPDKIKLIKEWVEAGSPPPPNESLVEDEPRWLNVIQEWEGFMNTKDYKHQLTSRYLYEHLFLAHLYISENSNQFYRIIRSKTTCDNPQMISTRTPNDDPGINSFYYCIVKFNATIVNKNHLPYEISLNKLNWIKTLFIDSIWSGNGDELPPYKKNIVKYKMNLKDISKGIIFPKENDSDIRQNKIASNPFLVFKNIPQEARYRFLLEDSYYHVMTFMKGTSCNGTLSVNAVQDHFFVLFMSPEADVKINTPEVLEQFEFPGRYGNEVEDEKISSYFNQTNSRKKSRQKRNENLLKEFPSGLPLDALWNGNRTLNNERERPTKEIIKLNDRNKLLFNNKNAILTILRHNDSASVVQGPLGDLTKTVFVMDYSTFERMAYDLVINFDVFGNFGHMLLTRTYMGLIRSDAEDNYLSFLPLEIRNKLLDIWYNDRESEVLWDKLKDQGLLDSVAKKILDSVEWSRLHKKLLDEKVITSIPNVITFSKNLKDPREYHLELMQKILFEYLGPEIIGPDDTLNWRRLKSVNQLNNQDRILSELTKEVKDKKHPYVYFFPELSYLVLGHTNENGTRVYKKFYSLVHNREFNSISLMIGEDYRHTPEEDTLLLSKKIIGYYPNQFFYVEDNEASIRNFVDSAFKITSKNSYQKFLDQYGISRVNPEIWNVYDYIVDQYRIENPIEAGYLDLSRYNYY